MAISNKTREAVRAFAEDEAGKHLSKAQISYFERLGRKSGQIKDKILRNVSKFKLTSKDTIEARDDLELFMNDYIADLMLSGAPEDEAFQIAKAALKADSGSDKSVEIRDKYMEYYLNAKPGHMEAVGLFYGGFLFLGVAIGAIAGFLVGGGRLAFLDGGWIDTLIGTFAGAAIGMGLGELSQAMLIVRSK